jgi:hypothetical protein
MRGTFRHYTLVLGMHMLLVPAKFSVALVFAEASTVKDCLTLEQSFCSCCWPVVFLSFLSPLSDFAKFKQLVALTPMALES